MKRKFIYSESKLSEVTGLSRTILKRLRLEMPKGKYWRKSKKGKGGSIELSAEAVDIVLKTFGIPDTDLTRVRIDFTPVAESTIDLMQVQPAVAPRFQTEVAPPSTGLSALPDLKLLTVCALPPNKRIVKARNGSEAVFDVIVPSNLVWSIGDPLRAKQSKHQGYMELVGPAPRWRSDRLYRHTFV